MNGKVTSNVGQRVAIWPVFPQEKHFTSDHLRRTCRSLGPCRGDCCSAKYVRSVAVACGVRLACSVVMVYSVLLSVSLVARAPI